MVQGTMRGNATVTRRLRPPALLAVLLMLIGACGSNTDSPTEAGSPLAEFLGEESFGFDPSDEESQAKFAEQEREREEAVATCMSEQGFEYIPQDTSDFNFASGGPDGIPYDSREWAEKYGFGITTQRFSQEEVGPDLVGWDEQAFEEEAFDDPNQAIVEAMDQSTQEAYFAALYGDEDDFPEIDPTMTDEEIDAATEDFSFEPQGCYGLGFANDNVSGFYQDFDDELQKMYEAIEDDPRIVEAQQEISDCVAGKGLDFPVGDGGEFYERFDKEMQAIDESIGGFPGEDLSEEDFAAMTDEELDALFNTPRELPAEAKVKLGEIQAEEIELAVAVWDCGGGFGGSADEDLYRTIVAEYEERFLSENADRLAEYKAE